MRRCLSRLLAAATLLAAVPAQAADPAQWAGKFPSDKLDGKTLWETLGPAFDAAVGARLARTVRDGWGPEVPVVVQDGWTIAYACKAHDCGDNNVTLAISPQRRIIACTLVGDDKDGGTWREAARPPRAAGNGCPEGAAVIAALRRAGLTP
ncbi:MAG: hypothetical protein KIT36_15660 [Alphaproteobacteria bacterium]|nr:hypothetical protein [Alphaproteobacteria bacterium]